MTPRDMAAIAARSKFFDWWESGEDVQIEIKQLDIRASRKPDEDGDYTVEFCVTDPEGMEYGWYGYMCWFDSDGCQVEYDYEGGPTLTEADAWSEPATSGGDEGGLEL